MTSVLGPNPYARTPFDDTPDQSFTYDPEAVDELATSLTNKYIASRTAPELTPPELRTDYESLFQDSIEKGAISDAIVGVGEFIGSWFNNIFDPCGIWSSSSEDPALSKVDGVTPGLAPSERLSKGDLEKYLNQVKKFIQQWKDHLQDEDANISMERILFECLKRRMEDKDEELRTKQMKFCRDHERKKALKAEKRDLENDIIDGQASIRNWDILTQVTQILTLSMSAMTAHPALAVVSFVCASAIALDTYYEKAGTKAIAKFFAGEDKELQERIETWINFGSMILSAGLYFGSTGVGGLSPALSAAQGISQFLGMTSQTQISKIEAILIKLNFEIEDQLNRKKLKQSAEGVGKIYKDMHEDHSKWMRLENDAHQRRVGMLDRRATSAA